MSKSFHYIAITIFSLFVFLNAKAQDTSTVEAPPPVEMADTVYETSLGSTYHFKEATANKIEEIGRAHV